MATRSRIGIQNQDGTVSSIYSHWDGYPSHNGKILKEQYTDRSKVESLIALGSISSLAESTECPEGHGFENRIDGYTVAYHRDRGEDLSIQTHSSVESYLESNVEEYGYLYTLEGEWICIDGYSRKKLEF
jgi:hypothetical protein